MKRLWFFECLKCGERIPFGFEEDEVAKLREDGELRVEFLKDDPKLLVRNHMVEKHKMSTETGEANGILSYELVN